MPELTRFPILPITAGLNELLEDKNFCQKIEACQPEIDLLLQQLQLDHVTEENRATCGDTLLALKLFREAFFLFTTKGRADRKREEAKK